VFVNFDHEPLLIDLRALLPHKIIKHRIVGCRRKALQNILRNRAQACRTRRNNISRIRIAYLIALAIRANDGVNGCRIVDLAGKDGTPGGVEDRLPGGRIR
jgi:hypothetical protein